MVESNYESPYKAFKVAWNERARRYEQITSAPPKVILKLLLQPVTSQSTDKKGGYHAVWHDTTKYVLVRITRDHPTILVRMYDGELHCGLTEEAMQTLEPYRVSNMQTCGAVSPECSLRQRL
jgi:hypothetical protein